MYGIDWLLISFMSLYGIFAVLCFAAAYKKYKKYKNKKRRANLTLIRGGKKEDGPYGKSR
jgi:hypothetical protein